MLAGIPVITTTAGALPEVVGEAALLVPPLDHDALVAGLIEILRDDARRASLVEAGTTQAARYDWRRTAAGLVDLYHRASA
jgi:glycosyltransferase involved in cell wall biosynthesis